MPKAANHSELTEKLENVKWRVDFIGEMFTSAGPDRFHLSETALSGLGCIMDDIRHEIEDVVIALQNSS